MQHYGRLLSPRKGEHGTTNIPRAERDVGLRSLDRAAFIWKTASIDASHPAQQAGRQGPLAVPDRQVAEQEKRGFPCG